LNDRGRAILEIDDLTVVYRQNGTRREAVRHVSIDIPPGQTCGLVGESGSGKTTLALAAMRYLPENGQVARGAIRFNGRNLLELGDRELRKLWGAQMALVPQEAISALNPSLRLGEQVSEMLRHHQGLDRAEARERSLELFETVQLSDPERVFEAYPHQISGGMLQRVLTAMAISTEPLLLALDEPTSSLDVTTQAAMLDLFRHLMQGRSRTAVLYITHNLGVVAQISDRLAVMYAGELVEDAPTVALYRQPLHPYTQGLLDCIPRLGENKTEVRLRPIEGRLPPLTDLPEGCIFRPRCPLAIDICKEYPPLYDCGEGRRTRCHRWEEIQDQEIDPHQSEPKLVQIQQPGQGGEAVLELNDLEVHFSGRRSIADIVRGKSSNSVRAVDGVSLEIREGRMMGLVGESGSGKTTLARAVVGLDRYTAGQVRIFRIPAPPGLGDRSEEVLCCVQIIFQNPDEALNPYMSVGEALRRPVERLRRKTAQEAREVVEELLRVVHLSPEYATRLPGQLSGGEKQRIALARAIAPNPHLLIADEPVSSLDVSVQASMLNLFSELQEKEEIATLFISHDLAVVGYLADDVTVMYLGQAMEVGPSRAIFDPPYHPYTEALLSAIPLLDPEGEQEEIRLKGEVPSPAKEISGCPFHTRCPRFVGDICVKEVPPWRVDEESGKRTFCHIPHDELREKQRRAFRMRQRGSEGV